MSTAQNIVPAAAPFPSEPGPCVSASPAVLARLLTLAERYRDVLGAGDRPDHEREVREALMELFDLTSQVMQTEGLEPACDGPFSRTPPSKNLVHRLLFGAARHVFQGVRLSNRSGEMRERIRSARACVSMLAAAVSIADRPEVTFICPGELS